MITQDEDRIIEEIVNKIRRTEFVYNRVTMYHRFLDIFTEENDMGPLIDKWKRYIRFIKKLLALTGDELNTPLFYPLFSFNIDNFYYNKLQDYQIDDFIENPLLWNGDIRIILHLCKLSPADKLKPLVNSKNVNTLTPTGALLLTGPTAIQDYYWKEKNDA